MSEQIKEAEAKAAIEEEKRRQQVSNLILLQPPIPPDLVVLINHLMHVQPKLSTLYSAVPSCCFQLLCCP